MIRSETDDFINGILRSYSQVFFSENQWFALPVIFISFLDLSAGLSGFLAVLTANVAASILGFDSHSSSKGNYGFNSLLAGLGLGYYYHMTFMIAAMAIIAGLVTMLLSVVMQGILSKYYLPYLSLPFVFSLWLLLSAAGMINGLELNQTGVYLINRLFEIGGHPLVRLHQWWISHITSGFLNAYFLSLGAIFFQFNVFAGIVIAISLLLWSRIAFLLSLTGFSVAWFAFVFFGVDFNQLGYSFIGFNFILGAIAIGAYFYVPSPWSFAWAVAMTPATALSAVALTALLKPFSLGLLSLPFNLTVLIFLYSFRFRTKQKGLREVVVQEGSPELNLYSSESFHKRFPDIGKIKILLPFYGEWTVEQGYNGRHTHIGEWAHAWDFVITGNDGSSFSGKGDELTDYYCYGQNILAPADGMVIVATDGIDDNAPGMINTEKNWGNTIIIKHSDGLYSKLCHLRKGSVAVKTDEVVRQGQVIGKVGSSGRSPWPHLHLQLQAEPFTGARTIKYPLASYISDSTILTSYGYPEEKQKIKNAEINTLLKRSFSLYPGTRMVWRRDGETDSIIWEVLTNQYNVSYIKCLNTGALAWFRNDGVFLTFTHFKGNRNSLLYDFYMAAYRLPLVPAGTTITDSLSPDTLFSKRTLFLHDLAAPFFMYLKAEYFVSTRVTGPPFDPDKIEFSSTIKGYFFKRLIRTKQYILEAGSNNNLTLIDLTRQTAARCEPY